MSSLSPARLHDAMAARVAAGELPGLVIVLARGDEVHVEAIGTYGFDDARPMRRDTLFRIASMTKPVLATAALTLVEDGLLDLTEPVDRLLPELADRRVLTRLDGPLDETVPAHRPITVEDLLTSRMGYGMLTEPVFDPPYPVVLRAAELGLQLGAPDPRIEYPPDEWLRRFATLPLMYQPGERWQYNVASFVLGVLVARAGGGSLPAVLHERIFAPLGMADTGFQTTPEEVARIPGWYFTAPGTSGPALQELSPPEQWTQPWIFPSGAAGLLSTADDYLTFARLLRDGGVHEGKRLLSAESVARMTTNQLTPEQVDTAEVLLDPKGWGYGMAATPDRYGWDGGYGTVWLTDPVRDLIAIALTQTSDFLFTGGRDEFIRLARLADGATRGTLD